MATKRSTFNKLPRATVRTYRHGLGDCHLVTLFGAKKSTYKILIDCGVILGTPNANAIMTEVMEDVVAASDGRVDLLVATHEHWDHLSGFEQAAPIFSKLKVDSVWMAWTEDPQDPDARKLRGERDDALALLHTAAVRMQLDGSYGSSLMPSLLEFFGAAARTTTASALERVRAKVAHPRYCDPKDPPLELSGFAARIYTLGPPRDVKLLKTMLPTSAGKETYSMALEAFEQNVSPALLDSGEGPFSGSYCIPNAVAQSTPFFQANYWSDEAWRRIEAAWMEDATQLALALDSMTNNTSLVLAIDLEGLGVLLFAADAQVGNWMSWGNCTWQVNGKVVTGEELVRRTIFYKVGHHGSHNATLKAKGLELMDALKVAVIPVDHEMALKKNWGNIPLGALVTALGGATGGGGCVLRTDEDPAASVVRPGVRYTKLYFDVDV